MSKYKVYIQNDADEQWDKVTVEAEDENEAMDKARDLWVHMHLNMLNEEDYKELILEEN